MNSGIETASELAADTSTPDYFSQFRCDRCPSRATHAARDIHETTPFGARIQHWESGKMRYGCDEHPAESYVFEFRRLTAEERRIASMAAMGASSEVSSLLAIIERLTGEKITPADELRTE